MIKEVKQLDDNSFKYRNKEWLFQQLIVQGKTETAVATENGWTQRVVSKWAQIYGLGDNNFKKLKELSAFQEDFIKAEILGDGHITKEGMLIISHCASQKDYLYWKFNILKDCCKTPPTEYAPSAMIISGKECKLQSHFRFNTRKIDALKTLKEISKVDIISKLNKFQFAIWMLDDGYRDKWTWDLCLGDKDEEFKKSFFLKMAQWGLMCKSRVDRRYVRFDCKSTRQIDDIIQSYLPPELDIIKNKILHRK